VLELAVHPPFGKVTGQSYEVWLEPILSREQIEIVAEPPKQRVETAGLIREAMVLAELHVRNMQDRDRRFVTHETRWIGRSFPISHERYSALEPLSSIVPRRALPSTTLTMGAALLEAPLHDVSVRPTSGENSWLATLECSANSWRVRAPYLRSGGNVPTFDQRAQDQRARVRTLCDESYAP
jgi:hypothetical protein